MFRACADLHWRLAIVPAALLTLATSVPGLVSSTILGLGRGGDLAAWGASAMGLLAVAVGTVTLLAAGHLSRLVGSALPVDDSEGEGTTGEEGPPGYGPSTL